MKLGRPARSANIGDAVLFTVVIPSYNHEKYLDEAVRSCLTSLFVTEVLIGDDGSRDGSVAMIESMERRFFPLVRNLTEYPPRNIGAHAMLNRLVGHASNEWVAVLNSDDKFVPGRFTAIRNRVRADKADFCFGNIAIMDDKSVVTSRKRAFLDPQFPFPHQAEKLDIDRIGLLSRLLCQNYIATTSNMAFTKSLWRKVGGFGNFRYAHDWDFAVRCMYSGTPAYVADYLTFYRIHGSNTIKEARALQDAEVKQIFNQLEIDFEMSSNPDFLPFLAANEYIASSR